VGGLWTLKWAWQTFFWGQSIGIDGTLWALEWAWQGVRVGVANLFGR